MRKIDKIIDRCKYAKLTILLLYAITNITKERGRKSMNEKVRKILIRYIEEISGTDEWVSEDILDHIIEEVEAAKRGENEHYKKPELVLKDYNIKACWDWAFNFSIEPIND